MQIIINNSSMQPIYEQIVGQIKGLILNGTLQADTALPSVRQLGKDLRISTLTVKKAYDALEQEGFVITVHGKGSYIASTNAELMLEERRKKVESKLEEAVREGRSCGMTDGEITEMLSLIMEDL
ncbi:MAG: GntR family transcriptional regulator [Lachnospiraceae bacterium]|nr:GntR family transcriptional regulator [Lachnospiraceae bacterium]